MAVLFDAAPSVPMPGSPHSVVLGTPVGLSRVESMIMQSAASTAVVTPMGSAASSFSEISVIQRTLDSSSSSLIAAKFGKPVYSFHPDAGGMHVRNSNPPRRRRLTRQLSDPIPAKDKGPRPVKLSGDKFCGAGSRTSVSGFKRMLSMAGMPLGVG